VVTAKGETMEADFRASNEIAKLPAGPLALALGGSFRREKYEFISAQVVRDADVPGLGGSISTVPSTSRNIYAAYAEANVPITKTFEANVAIRFDDYEDVGNTTNPKISLRWTPTKQLLLRTAYGTGFRAPSMPELNTPAFFGATGGNYDDPVRCPQTGSPRDCNTQFTTKLGGNLDLKPEESKNFTAGFLLEPSARIHVRRRLLQDQDRQRDRHSGGRADLQQHPGFRSRGPHRALRAGKLGCPTATAGIPCPVNYGIQTLVNLSELKTEGVDFNANYRFPPVRGGGSPSRSTARTDEVGPEERRARTRSTSSAAMPAALPPR
jgi:iron complex outermembrane receptor protein